MSNAILICFFTCHAPSLIHVAIQPFCISDDHTIHLQVLPPPWADLHFTGEQGIEKGPVVQDSVCGDVIAQCHKLRQQTY